MTAAEIAALVHGAWRSFASAAETSRLLGLPLA
jgi:hypothetical protein